MSLHKKILGILFSMGCVMACEDSVDPSDRFEPRMVVYSILSTDTDTQFVRVYANYNPPDFDPAKNTADRSIRNANVLISDGVQTFVFRDTMLARPDTSRYKDSIAAYVAYGFRPQAGMTYVLTVTSAAHGTITQSTQLPGSGSLQVGIYQVLINPWCNSQTPSLTSTLLPPGGAYAVRFMIEYEEQFPTGTRVRMLEVPSRIQLLNAFLELYSYFYPPIVRRDDAGNKQVASQWPRGAYIYALEQINGFAFNHRLRRVIFFVIQYNEAWYKYYSSTRTFQDSYSIRLDEPDFGNIPGGLGLFAGRTVDSVSVPIPCIMTAPRRDLPCPNNVIPCP